MGVNVTLTWYEVEQSAHIGAQRFAFSEARGWNPASTYPRGWLERLRDDIVGACGERAWAKATGTYFEGGVNTFHATPDAPGNVEVRSSLLPGACLIVRDNDAPDRHYALVTGEPPNMTVHGWILGADARRPEYLRDPRNSKRPAWFVPQGALQLRRP